tara:strand:+ start:304002 stop:304190 length:189 start_codon:yes stop_codon:yes gene_type:complete
MAGEGDRSLGEVQLAKSTALIHNPTEIAVFDSFKNGLNKFIWVWFTALKSNICLVKFKLNPI